MGKKKKVKKHTPGIKETMAGRSVKCESCGAVIYETTEQYDPDKPLTGDMLRLLEPYRSYNWPTYDGSLDSSGTPRFQMFCTMCAGYITATGELSFVDLEPWQGAVLAMAEKVMAGRSEDEVIDHCGVVAGVSGKMSSKMSSAEV